MKLCKNCEHFFMGDCFHPDLNERSPINGNRFGRDARQARRVNYLCGPDALKFEERIGFWKRIFGKKNETL